jgi:hypothetical protein
VVRTQAEVRPAVFRSLPRGWHQFDEGVQSRGRCHAVANTFAANWRADRAGSYGWAAEMPPDAIAITVSLIGPINEGERHPEYLPVSEFPLELPLTTVGSLEGWPDVPEYRVFGRTPDYLVEVRAAINNPERGSALVEEARSMVRRLHLPDWPELCRSAD